MRKIIEVHQAEGGEDSRLFALDLIRAYGKLAERMG